LGPWADPLELPDFAESLIVPTTDPDNFPEPSINDYCRTMSAGTFLIYGDNYPELVVCSNTYSAGQGNAANEEVVRSIAHDSSFSFADFDVDPEDGYVDRVLLVWRTRWFDRSAHPYIFQDTVHTWDGTIVNGYYGIVIPAAVNEQQVLGTLGHELLHVFCLGEESNCLRGIDKYIYEYTGPYGVSTAYGYRGVCMSAYERYRQCWLAVEDIEADTVGLRIPDTITSGKAYRIFVPDTTADTSEYFLLEYRNRANSWYEEFKGSLEGCDNYKGNGLLIWHVYEGSTCNRCEPDLPKFLDVESAAGRFAASDYSTPDPARGRDELDSLWTDSYRGWDTLDFYNENWNNTFTPYTNPGSHGYREVLEEWEQSSNSGISITNVRIDGDSVVVVDIHFDTPPDTILHDTHWARWVMLNGDLVVPDSVTLTVDAGAVVSFTPKTDYEESGWDTGKAELIIDGDLGAIGTSARGDTITFRPAGMGRGYAPDTLDRDDWYGIRLRGSAGDTLAHCRIRNAYTAISLNDVSASSDTTLIRHCLIDSNLYAGIECDHADPIIDSCVIEYAGSDSIGGLGMFFLQSDARLWENKIRKNLPYNVYWIGGTSDSGSYARIENCLIGSFGQDDPNDAYGIVLTKNMLRDSKVAGTTVRKQSQGGIHLTYHWGFVDVDDCLISNNFSGIRANPKVSSPPGADDTLVVSSTAFKLNTVGVIRQNLGGTVILGDDAAGLGGDNQFLDSDSCVYNALASTVMAENCWWGDSLGPAANDTVGPVDAYPWLLKKPGSGGQFGPRRTELLQDAVALRYCNPSTGSVEFALTLNAATDVMIHIYDVRGRLVTIPFEESLTPGIYGFAWNGRDSSGRSMGAGVYFCRVSAGRHTKTSKVVLLK
jgi:M6 family metalloprotease-like protein